MKASDFIARFLQAQKISHVFELSGGMITHLLDSIQALKSIEIISMHHEQGAAFAVDGFSRISGIPGVAMATSGPGATNLLTGIGSCFFDSVPAIFITGQVNQHEQKGDRPIRQLGFQETDIISMALPITKGAFKVENANDIPSIFKKAFQLALSGRPGPVLIDIPMNLQRADIEEGCLELVNVEESPVNRVKDGVFEELFHALKQAKKPLILAGRGVMSSNSKSEFIRFVETTGIPVVTSLLGLEAISYNHPLRVGFIGAYGNRWANLAIGECDCMLVIGSRLDIRQTGADVKGFKADKTIFHIDIEKGEVNNRVTECIPIVTNAKQFIIAALDAWANKAFNSYEHWIRRINELRSNWPDTLELSECKGINPNIFMHKLSKASHLACAYLADVGTHQMWAAQSLEVGNHQSFLTSGGMGAMGFALPAAIGASIASNNKPVVTIIGDGCMQINIQELQTIVRNKLPIKIVVVNNKSLGMIRQFQDSYFDSRYQSTMWGYSAPDFEKVAKAYDIDALTVYEQDDIDHALEKMWKSSELPFLLQVMVDPFTNCYPKIAFGKPITEMEPFSKPIEMEGT